MHLWVHPNISGVILKNIFIERKSTQFKPKLFEGQPHLYKSKAIAVKELDVHVVQLHEWVSLHVLPVPQCFKMQDLSLLRYRRSVDQEMTAIRREFVILTDPRRRGHVTPGRAAGGGTRVHQDLKVGGVNNTFMITSWDKVSLPK